MPYRFVSLIGLAKGRRRIINLFDHTAEVLAQFVKTFGQFFGEFVPGMASVCCPRYIYMQITSY
jgi:hypothetical protein